MAHPCIECGSECYCHGDIDDAMVSRTPVLCEGCGCKELFYDEDSGPDDDDDDDPRNDFHECGDCDGHPACRDFGCAITHGLGHLIEPPL